MGRRLWIRSALVAGLLFAPATWAYVPMIDSRGNSVRWVGTPKLNLVANAKNSSGFPAADLFDLSVKGLQRWSQGSRGSVAFDFWQGDGNGTGLEYNGQSNLFFATNNSASSGYLSSNTLALTQVWYNTATGQILEADIVLNDRDFRFSNDPRDSVSGYGRIYLGNVLTHELGHAYGLSHSG